MCREKTFAKVGIANHAVGKGCHLCDRQLCVSMWCRNEELTSIMIANTAGNVCQQMIRSLWTSKEKVEKRRDGGLSIHRI